MKYNSENENSRLTVSVIIPMYNGENYIITCLESIKRQQYTPVEVVIVNDASTDHSAEMVENYRKKNEEYMKIVLINQENQGQGAARNTGIMNASGKYITFLDQDDQLEEGCLAQMVLKAESESADIVCGGYRRTTKEGKVKQEVRLQKTEWSKFKVIAPWAKLYLTKFIKENNIRFLPVVLGEDIFFLMQAYSYLPKIVYWNGIGYNWLDNSSSVSNTSHKKLNQETSLLRLFDMLEQLECRQNLENDKMYEYFLMKTAVWDILYTARNNSYDKVMKNSSSIWEWFNKHFKEYQKNPYVKLRQPKGETCSVRTIVWTYMKIKKCGLEKLFLRIFSRKNERETEKKVCGSKKDN